MKTPHLRGSVIAILTWMLVMVSGAAAQDEVLADASDGRSTQGVIRNEPRGTLIGQDLLRRWRDLSGPEGMTPEIEILINEGRLLLFQADEFEQQMSSISPDLQGAANLRLMRLRSSFTRTLYSLELERAQNYPLPQLLSIRRRYVQEQETLMDEIAEHRRELIQRAEHFLGTYHTNEVIQSVANRDEIIADVMFRLGDLYYTDAEERYYEELDEFNEITAEMAWDAELPPEPEPDYSRAINTYRRIIDEFPSTSYVADALYNIAYIQSETPDNISKRQSRDTFEALVNNFPDSRYVAESNYRIGNHLFGDLAQPEDAIPYFESVLEYPESDYYDRALYMLGWCYFRLNNAEFPASYDSAIAYFDRTLQYTFDQQESEDAPSYTSLAEEATNYLAVTFSQDVEDWHGAGLENAVTFIESDSSRHERYGYNMIRDMGEIYRVEVRDDEKAVNTYEELVGLYPVNPDNPWVQMEIIELYTNSRRVMDLDKAYEARNEMFENHRRGSEWDVANQDPELREAADTLLSSYYYTNYNIAIQQALDRETQESIDEALGITQNYLTEFPLTEKTPRVQYTMGALLQRYQDNVEFQVNAFTAFYDVVTRWGDNEWQENSAVQMVRIAMDLVEREKSGVTIPSPSFVVPREEGEAPLPWVDAIAEEEPPTPVEEPAPTPVQETPMMPEGDVAVPAEGTMEEESGETGEPDSSEMIEEDAGGSEEEIPSGMIDEDVEEVPGDVLEETPAEESGEGEETDTPETAEPDSTVETGSLPEHMWFWDEIPDVTPEGWDPLENAYVSIGDQDVPTDTTTQADPEETPEETTEELTEEIPEETPEDTPEENVEEEPVAADMESTPVDQEVTTEEEPSSEMVDDSGEEDLPGDVESQEMDQPEEGITTEEPGTDDAGEEMEEGAAETTVAGEDVEVTPADTLMAADEPDTLMADDVTGEVAPVAEETVAEADTVAEEVSEQAQLLRSEHMLLAAIDTFADYFPENPQAPDIIYQGGFIFYSKQRYPESRRYFERIVRDYPHSRHVEDAYAAILDGYFQSGEYQLAEETAVRIANSGVGGELLAAAETRRAESIFRNAEQARNSDDVESKRTAAFEFRRTATTVSGYEYADAALLESGITFMTIEDWEEAIISFQLLADTYPQSEHAPTALYNIGVISADNFDPPRYLEAAQALDRMASQYPNNPNVQGALARASEGYEAAEQFNDAIRVNLRYVDLFPDAPDTKAYLFDTARFYLQLDNEAQAMEIYNDFARRYPNDQLTVQAYYEQAEYFLRTNQRDRASATLQGTIDAHNRLVEQGGVGYPEYASQAMDQLLEWQFEEYAAIQYRLPQSAMDRSRARKEALREELIEGYNTLISYGKKEAWKGIYRIAVLDELIAQAFATREIAGVDGDVVTIDGVTEAQERANEAIDFYFGAMGRYEESGNTLAGYVDTLSIQLTNIQQRYSTLQTTVNTLQMQSIDINLDDSTKAVLQQTMADSQRVMGQVNQTLTLMRESLGLAQAYRDSARYRIPVIYVINADLQYESSISFFGLPDEGRRRIEKLIYRNQVLQALVLPRIRTTVEMYLDAVNASDSLNLGFEANYADTARYRIVTTADTLYENFKASLNVAVEDGYDFYVGVYERLLEWEDEEAKAYGLYVDEVPFEIGAYQDQVRIYSTAAQDVMYQILALTAQDEGGHDIYMLLAEEALGDAWNNAQQFIDFQATCYELQEARRRKFERKMLFLDQEAIENYEILAVNWNDHILAQLEACWVIPEQLFYRPQPLTNDIARKLVEFAPATYAYLLGISETTNYILSDTTWLATTEWIDGWDLLECDESSFVLADSGAFPGPIDADMIEGANPMVIGLFEVVYDTTMMDTLVPDPNYVPEVPDTTFGMNDTLTVDSLSIDSMMVDAGDSLAVDDSLSVGDTLAFAEGDTVLAVDSLMTDTLAVLDSLVDSLAFDTTMMDTALAEQDTIPPGYMVQTIETVVERQVGAYETFFRHHFHIEDRITYAQIQVTADDNIEVYLNGEFMLEDDAYNNEDWNIVDIVEITEYLNVGDNVISMMVSNPDSTQGGMWFRLVFNTIPEMEEGMDVVLPGENMDVSGELQGGEGQPFEEIQDTPDFYMEPETVPADTTNSDAFDTPDQE